jgi:hypothetical protein
LPNGYDEEEEMTGRNVESKDVSLKNFIR